MLTQAKKTVVFFQDYKTYLDFVLALENKKEPQVKKFSTQLLQNNSQEIAF